MLSVGDFECLISRDEIPPFLKQTLLGLGFFEALEVVGVPETLRNLGLLGLLGIMRRCAWMQDDPQPSIKPFVLRINCQHLCQPLLNLGIFDDSRDSGFVEVLVALESGISLFIPETAIENAKFFSQGKLESFSSFWISRRQAIKGNQGIVGILDTLQ